ncbi:MAG: hypothetical protein U0939_09635 [Pirellulales bacterium]
MPTNSTQPPRAAWLVVMAVVCLLLAPATTSAQKIKPPPPPPPPPAGAILFDASTWPSAQWGMNVDGSEKRVAFLHQFMTKPVPSARVYGTDPVRHRWWLALGEVQVVGAPRTVYEVFACRPDQDGNLQQVQLTALYPFVDFHHTSGAHSYLGWSNNGTDSFVSFRGKTYGAEDAQTPANLNDPSDDLIHIFRLNFSASQIEAALTLGVDPKFGINEFSTGTLESVLEAGGDLTEWVLAYHDWSPSGKHIAYSTPWGLWVADCTVGTATHGDAKTRQIWTECRFPRWSPNGLRIAMSHDGNVWTISPDGSGAAKVLGKTRSDSYSVPVWSPDNSQLAVSHRRAKGVDSEYFLSRVPAAGGTITILTKELDPTVERRPTGWSANVVAGP